MFEMREITDRGSLAREVRAHTVAEIEVRSGEAGLTFDGVASVVDTPYEVNDMFGGFEETIRKGAFTKTLKEKSDVRFLVNHAGLPLARTKSKTLTLTASPDLRAVAELDPENPTVQELRSAIARGDVDQMSIGFRVHRQEWNEDYTQRSVIEAELFDVSAVTYPASPTTTASLRSIADLMAMADIEMDDGELRRIISLFEARLSAPSFADRDRDDLARLLRKRHPEIV